MGVTIAHAKDVLARLESGSPTRSHAAEINVDVMPWECLFCPFWGNATVGPNSPGITDLAIGVGDGVGRASTGPTSEDMTRPWLRPAPPDWATQLLEVTQGREDQMAEMAWHLIDLPTSVQFALVTQLRDKNH